MRAPRSSEWRTPHSAPCPRGLAGAEPPPKIPHEGQQGCGCWTKRRPPRNATAPRLFRSLSVCSAAARSCFTTEESGPKSPHERQCQRWVWPSPIIFKSTWAINRHTNSSRESSSGQEAALQTRGTGRARQIGTCCTHASSPAISGRAALPRRSEPWQPEGSAALPREPAGRSREPPGSVPSNACPWRRGRDEPPKEGTERGELVCAAAHSGKGRGGQQARPEGTAGLGEVRSR